ncbi:histone H1-like [Impatiens glandulifera]|uniref:histone H1-like n=1 Tax=Impatiens glandulifera TaxID=253017 RepID=UPI001FB17112|nr:histone H1-like [Impatiens glandulifera]
MATEEAVAVVEAPPAVVEAEPAAVVQPAENAGKVKTVKEPKPKKARNPPTHPPYLEMITEAIVSLKEKNGSSQYAITKFIEEKQKQLPPNFKKLLLVQLKKLVSTSKLVKVKASFKLPAQSKVAKSAAAAPAKKKPAPAPAKAKKTVKPDGQKGPFCQY